MIAAKMIAKRMLAGARGSHGKAARGLAPAGYFFFDAAFAAIFPPSNVRICLPGKYPRLEPGDTYLDGLKPDTKMYWTGDSFG